MTKPEVKAAFFDVDGTLMSFKTHQLSESSRRALSELRARGVRCFLSTGRPYSLLGDVPLELFDAHLTMSGQYCCLADGTVFHACSLDRDDMRVVVEQVRAGLYECLFMEPNHSFLSGRDVLVDRAFTAANVDAPIEDVSRALEDDIYQLNVFVTEDRNHVLLDATKHLRVTRWSPSFVDVMPADGGKQVGVAKTLELYGLTPEQAIAFGDGEGDRDMFAAVGTSVAMGNADEGTKACATMVTDSVDDDGIYNACVRLGLI